MLCFPARFLKRSGIFLMLIGVYSNISGQSLITTTTSSDQRLNVGELRRMRNLEQDSLTKNISLVTFGDPAKFFKKDGSLEFALPGLRKPLRAEAVHITRTDTSYSWSGKFTNESGYMSIYEIRGRRAAWFQIGGQFFEIMPIKDNVSTLREIRADFSDSTDCFIGRKEGKNPESVNDFCNNAYNTCTARIDILVLIPPDVVAWLDQRFGSDYFAKALYVGLGTQVINTAFTNSDIPNKSVNITMESFNFNPLLHANFNNALNALKTQSASRRDANGADLVVLLTAKDFPGGAGAAIGEPTDPPSGEPTPAVAIVEMAWHIGPRWTFAHEVGHLLGAKHSRTSPGPGDDDHPACGHGWTVGGNRQQRTMMAPWLGTPAPSDTRILHFSNPAVNFNGDVTGAATSDNARTIRNCGCVIANYRQRYDFDVFLSTDPWVCRDWQTIYLAAVVQQPSVGNPGIAPYSYDWRWNYSGNFTNDPGTYLGNIPGVSFPIPPTGTSLWVQLQVTSSDGLTITKLQRIQIYSSSDPRCNMERVRPYALLNASVIEAKVSSDIKIVPNPAHSEMMLSYFANEADAVDIRVLDITGRVVHINSRQPQSSGENNYRIDLSSLPQGIYTCTVQSGQGVKSVKFVIN